MTFQIRPRRTALLEQQNSQKDRQIDLLEDRIATLQEQLAMTPDPDAPMECDICALEEQRAYLEKKVGDELKCIKELKNQSLCNRFAHEGKSEFLCVLQRLQLLKWELATAELACVLSQIWQCKTMDYESDLCDLQECIDGHLETCDEQMNPFVADAIRKVLG